MLRALILALATILAPVLVMVCGLSAAASAQPRDGGTLVFARGADATFLDPAMFLDGESHKVIENIFDGLARFADGSLRVEPGLAESWDVSPDGLVWTFSLRQGVLFHDKTPFTAQAAAFSLARRTDPKHPYYREEFGKRDSSLSMIAKVEALDARRLRITLSEPSAAFLDALASHSAYMVSPAAVQTWGDEFSRHPVGTGAFAFDSWQPGERIRLVRNPDYWRGAPHLEAVVFEVVPGNTERFLLLKTGQAQAMDGLSPDIVSDVLKRRDLLLESLPGLNVGYLAMNMGKPPFDRIEVRRAVNHAINKASLIKYHFQDLAMPAKNPIPPTLPGYNDAVADYAYNPAEARRLLKEAGFPQGFTTTLWAMPVPRPYMPQPEAIAASIKANLAAVGILAELRSCDWQTYLARVYNGEHDMCLLGWVGSGADPDHFFHNLFDSVSAVAPHASNVAFFKNAEADALIHSARRTLDSGRREEEYRELQAIIHDQAPWVPLAHASQLWARSARAHDIVFMPSEAVLFYRAWLE